MTARFFDGPSETQNGRGISFYTKLLLNAALLGNEALLAFIMLMTIPVLQSLGSPLEFVSLYYIFQGAAAAILIPFLGVLSDRGKDPGFRKIVLVVVCGIVSLLGAVTLIGAVCLTEGRTEFCPNCTENTLFADNKTELTICYIHGTNQTVEYHGKGIRQEPIPSSDTPSNARENSTSCDVTSATNISVVSSNQTHWKLASSGFGSPKQQLSGAAILGMVAFFFLELAYDVTNSCVKACAVTCSPPDEQTSVLLLGLLVAGIGGCSTALLGTVDLSFLSAIVFTGNKVLQQAMVHVGINIVLTVVGTLCTVAAATHRRRQDRQTSGDFLLSSSSAQYRTFDNRSCSESNEMLVIGVSDAITETKPVDNAHKNLVSACFNSVLAKSGRNLAAVSLATYFALGAMQGFNMFSADFAGRRLFGGLPPETPGRGGSSEASEAYVKGVKLASRGILINYLLFTLVNVFNSTFLAYIGMKKEFLSAHLLLAGGLLWMVLDGSVAAFHINAVLVGVQRSLTYSLPFAVAVEYSRKENGTEMTKGDKPTRLAVGTAISVVGCMVPLSNCTLCSWFGPLAAVAGPDAPMYAAASCAVAASSFFALHGYL